MGTNSSGAASAAARVAASRAEEAKIAADAAAVEVRQPMR